MLLVLLQIALIPINSAAVRTSQHHGRVLHLTEQDGARCHDALALLLILVADGSWQSRVLVVVHPTLMMRMMPRVIIVLEGLDGCVGALRPHVMSV